MKAYLVGQHAADVAEKVVHAGFRLVPKAHESDIVIAYGGDGTLIGAEREFPGIPKLGIRDDRFCAKCEQHATQHVLERVARGHALETLLLKIEARVGLYHFVGMNDILVRNSDMRSAIRFSLVVNNDPVTDEIIGDGLVISTPFGSTAYFRSITNTAFRTGIGVAFNNCTDFDNHFVLRETDEIQINLRRGPADLTADNNPEARRVQTSEVINIRRSPQVGVVLALDAMRCGQCTYRNAPRRRF